MPFENLLSNTYNKIFTKLKQIFTKLGNLCKQVIQKRLTEVKIMNS